MTKLRLYHIALDWDICLLQLSEHLATLSSPYKSHLSEIDDSEIEEFRVLLETSGFFGEPEPSEDDALASDAEQADAAPEVSESGDAIQPEVTGSTQTATPEEAPQPSTKAPAAANTSAPGDRRPATSAKAPERRRDAKETGPKRSGPVGPESEERGAAAARSTPRNDTRKGPQRKGNQPTRAKFERQYTEEDVALSDSKSGIVVTRRTIPGAMHNATGRGSASRRKAQTTRDRERWRQGKGGRGRRALRRAAPVVRPSEVEIRLPITVKELSAATGIKLNELIMTLMGEGLMLSQSAVVPPEAITHVSHRFLIDITVREGEDLEKTVLAVEQSTIKSSKRVRRQPVVTVMGHVDHGKTTLLDYIRQVKSPVAGSEAGGITQHIGAYVAEHQGQAISFIDTPGHAAFTQMRSRGARVTDIVVLVVAADDGVNDQTREAYNHARAAGVEIIVALNKIDKDNADRDMCLDQLSKLGLQPIAWGGATEVIETSALSGQGVDELLETIIGIADLHEFSGNPDGQAFGHVIEAKKTKGRGVVATVLIGDGTLKKGDWVISGSSTGRVRMLFSDRGRPIKSAGPGVPVEVLGFDEVPSPGEKFHVFEAAKAKDLQDKRATRLQRETAIALETPTGESLWSEIDKQQAKRLDLIIRADVQGSLEVLKHEIPALSNEEVTVKVTHAGVGAVTENDIFLAEAEKATVIAFNTSCDTKASALARERGVIIESFQVIYELLDFVVSRMEDALEPEVREVPLGELVVRQTFKASRIGLVAGCYVDSGVVRRGARGRVMRDSIVIWEGDIDTLKRFKEDVKEVREGFECGVKLRNFDTIQIGDEIEVFEIQKFKRSLTRS